MNDEGPLLETLTRRLAECPAEFLAEPCIGATGTVHVEAVVSDLIHDLGGAPLKPEQTAAFQSKDIVRDRNRLRLALVACWLLHDGWFRERKQFAGQAYRFLRQDLKMLAGFTQTPQFVTDPDRREELARLCLSRLGLRPAGESLAQAQDRLTTISTAERQRVIVASRRAEERARQVREAMARDAARAAEMKAMRE